MFDVTAGRIDLFADDTRTMTTLDPLDRQQHVGLGCALENLVLALGARGFTPGVMLLPEPTDPTHVATVTFMAGPATSSDLHDAIGTRRSNRGPAATEAIIGDTPQSVDSFAWFRTSRDDIARHRDGLTLDGQGLSPVMLSAAKLLPASSRPAGDQFCLDQVRTVHTATATAYGVVTVADPDDPATRLTGGRLLQRIHLAATGLGLGLQHMNEVTERIDREASTGTTPTFAPALDALLMTPGRRVLSTVRIGHPERPARLSPRRDPSAVLR